MKRLIQLKGKQVEYDLTLRENARSIRVKVVYGKLKVSGPKYISIAEIENFIRQNEDHIIAQIEDSTLASYQDGGFVYILGYRYEIIHRNMHIRKCTIKENKIYVYGSNIQTTIEEYLQRALEEYIQRYISRFIQNHLGFPDPVITYKRTSGRYGACYYQINKVCFNPLLIHFKQEFIDSVIIHEMCHFKYHDHSPSFYREVEKYMPDYQRISGGKKVYD